MKWASNIETTPGWMAPAPQNNTVRRSDPHLLSDIDRLNQARAKLDRLTDQLEVIADWQDDFRKRRARAELKFALIGADIAEHEALVSEAKDFTRCCKILSWLGRHA